jgi:hypothetical protein
VPCTRCCRKLEKLSGFPAFLSRIEIRETADRHDGSSGLFIPVNYALSRRIEPPTVNRALVFIASVSLLFKHSCESNGELVYFVRRVYAGNTERSA